MFGRIRSSPSPAECLEFERPPSKIFKDDSLSIYEATLMRLKQGSQRSALSEPGLNPASQDSMECESNSNSLEGLSKGYDLCNGQPVSSHNSSCMGVSLNPNQEQRRGREISIHYLFSKYASSLRNQSLTCYSSGSSANTSDSSSDSELTGCSRPEF